MSAAPESTPGVLRVKRDGPRGWHWIAAANYDPAVHELLDAPKATLEEPNRDMPAKKPGRPKKLTEI